MADLGIDDILASVTPSTTSPETADLQSLTQAWTAERLAPELLPYPHDLMHRTLGRIAKQIQLIEDLTGTMDPRQSFRLVVLQTELERFKFLVRSFLRARLGKIDAFPLHYQGVGREYLSDEEGRYIDAHAALVAGHYKSAFLGQFPGSLQRLDDTAGGVNMVEVPDRERAVFVRVKGEVGVISVEGTDVNCDMRRGDVWVVRWSAVRDYVLGGQLELI